MVATTHQIDDDRLIITALLFELLGSVRYTAHTAEKKYNKEFSGMDKHCSQAFVLQSHKIPKKGNQMHISIKDSGF